MKDKVTYHSAITGKFVSKEYAKDNPDTTVELSNCNLRQVVTDFANHVVDLKLPLDENTIDDYFKENDKLR